MQKLDVKKIQFQLKQIQNNFKLLHKLLYYKNSLENKIIKSTKVKVYNHITIRVKANNIFCTLKKQNKTLCVGSSGIYKIHISKKILILINFCSLYPTNSVSPTLPYFLLKLIAV